MEPVSAQEIIAATGGSARGGVNLDKIWVQGVSTDTRTIQAGEIFFALKGGRFDGHDFLAQAMAKGASAAIASQAWSDEHGTEWDPAQLLIVVPDPLTALQDLAANYRRRFDVTLIGITGTNGKTTTKDMTAAALQAQYSTLKTEKNFNNQIGVPLTLFRISAKHRMVVVEMGMSGPGEIRRSAEISRPQHGLITNIGPAHLLQMGSLEAISRAKFELLEVLPAQGLAFLNGDDERVRAQTFIPPSRVITFGMGENVQYRVTAIRPADARGTEFQVAGQGAFTIPTWGRHNVFNALGAIAVGRELGIPADSIRQSLRDYQPSPMRMERLKIDQVTVLNDAYNANPASMRAALEVLAQTEADGRRVAVLGDMRELGEQEVVAHREMAGVVVSSGVDLLITVGQLADEIARQAVEDGFSSKHVIRCTQASQAARELKKLLRPGDVLLLKGSRAVALENILPVLSSPPREE